MQSNSSDAKPSPNEREATLRAVARLLDVMATLRAPGGCPWDREQTHRSLLPYLVEEAYELIDAVERGEDDAMRDELGDVLVQVVFHAQVAEERGAFGFGAVAAGLADKLVERHPHVFGGEPLATASDVNAAWHARKVRERESALDGVARHLPALQQALQVSARAARSGFDWNARDDIMAKAEEELSEFRAALQATPEQPVAEDAEAELGDLLFAIVQLARWQGSDPEAALRGATRKFSERFRRMERTLRARGVQPQQQSAAQWWALWEQVKSEAD